MALRFTKLSLIFALALFYTVLVFNNVTDYDSNYQFVRHVLMMDTTFPGNRGMWRAINSPALHTAFYVGIIGWEAMTMVACWWATVALARTIRRGALECARACGIAVAALTMSLLMWLLAFLTVGGEWFLMWQSRQWNGQDAAFRMFTVVGVVLLIFIQNSGDVVVAGRDDTRAVDE